MIRFLMTLVAAFCFAAEVPLPCPQYKGLAPGQRLAVVDIAVPLDMAAVTEAAPSQVRVQFSPPDLSFESTIKPPVGRFWGHVFANPSFPDVVKRMEQMAESGYAMGDMWGEKNAATLYFRRRPELYSAEERPAEPGWVAVQRAQLAKTFPKPGPKIEATVYGADGGTPNGILLTGRSLAAVEPGAYTWVRLRGENFIRIGKRGHLWLGGGEEAIGAGEITIERVAGENQVTTLNNQTATYSAKGDYLRNGIEALWRQGIYPSRLEISVWDTAKDKVVPTLTLQR